MKSSLLLKLALACSIVLAGFAARAEDIDIYGGVPAGAAANVLIIVDNTSSNDANYPSSCPFSAAAPNLPNSTLLDMVYCSVYGAINAIKNQPTLYGKLNIGLMSGGSGSNKGGAMYYPGASPFNLPVMDQSGITNFQSVIAAGIPKATGNAKLDGDMQEAWAWLTGTTGPRSGTSYAKHIGTQACQKTFIILIGAASKQGRPNTGSGFGSASDLAAAGATAAQQVQINTANIGPYTTNDNSWIDEWARFLNQSNFNPSVPTDPQNVITYTIAAGGTAPDYVQILNSTAKQGGGKPFVAGDYSSMVQALLQIFNEVQAVNSVFASASLPVSTNAQGTYLNQVFMGTFRPDGNGAPRWMGNLKQYQLGVDTSNPVSPSIFLADASWGPYQPNTSANAALSSAGTGFLSPSAISFWSSKSPAASPDAAPPTGTNGFWVSNPQGVGGAFDSPDGEFVEKGGAAQQIRLANLTDNYTTFPEGPRNVYTCLASGGASCTANTALSTMPFATTNANITSAILGITGSTPGVTRESLINWVRGYDSIGDEKSPGGGITIRPSVHGDVLHSRPAVINYGGTTGVVVFYGANDGMFRAINGNQPANSADTTKPMGNCTLSSTCAIPMKDAKGNITSVPPGGELWSFVAPEFYSKLQRLYNNSPVVKMPSTPTGIVPTPTPKDYFFDGSPSIYQNGGTAYLFLGARRGGRVLYALDVSDPAAPKFLWKHTNQDAGFSELGQTWSQPKVAMLSCTQNPNFSVATSTCNPSATPPKDPGYPVLVLGAGYDPNEDSEPPTADTMGRGIFILDAATGGLLWSATSGGSSDSCTGNPCKLQSMNYAMPADITLIDRDFDGFIDRLYAADTGGNIWRVDLKPAAGAPNFGSSNWQATLFAALGGTGATKRKFFYPPDVVLTNKYDVVLGVTGDREHPLSSQQANNVVNRFYMVKDTNVGMSAAGWTAVRDDTSSTADTQPTSLFNATSTTYAGTLSGFYVTLLGLNASGVSSLGEKGVNAPVTVGGLVHFGTNQPTAPSANSCQANLGTARSYAINFLTGASTRTVFDGGGLPPSPVFGRVTFTINGKQQQLPFLIGAGGGSGADSKSSIGAGRPTIPIAPSKKRTYWYRNNDR